MSGIYVASRVHRAPMWQKLRTGGFSITSTWIDEAGEGETEDFGELWERISDKLVLYAETDDFPLKGALGAASL